MAKGDKSPTEDVRGNEETPRPIIDENVHVVALAPATHELLRQAAERHGLPSPDATIDMLLKRDLQFPIGGDTFTVPLKRSEAEWVRNAARLRGVTPEMLIRSVVAQGRAADPSKGGTIAKTGDANELKRLAAGA